MTAKYQKPMLVGLSGPLKRKRIKLGAGVLSIGSSPDSDVFVPGQRVDKLHAQVSLRENGDWEIRNKSHWGTLINQVREDIAILSPGDTVQIGEQVVFRFDAKQPREKKAGRDKIGGSKTNSVTRRLAVVVAIVSCWAAAGVAIWFLSSINDDADTGGFTPDYIDLVLDKTRDYLAEAADLPNETNINASTQSRIDPRSDMAATYFEVMESTTDAQRDEALDSLLFRTRELFFDGWRLESMGDMPGAMKRYESISHSIPDARAPATQVAIWRWRILQESYYADE